MIGTTLAHYRITGELGAGGIGEARLTDGSLNRRRVALEGPPEELKGIPTHAEICRIYVVLSQFTETEQPAALGADQ